MVTVVSCVLAFAGDGGGSSGGGGVEVGEKEREGGGAVGRVERDEEERDEVWG